ncbi:MAG: hypothetical protein WAN50_01600 [Minisyncoccia bacterium]
MSGVKTFLKKHRPAVALAVIILALTALPALDIFLVLGNSWHGILPNFSDELNFARVHTIGEGHLTDGNAYYFEHRNGPPLVVFGGAWLNALPLFAGVPFNTALYINFIIWSLLFAAAVYWLFRELGVPRWANVFGTLLLYLEGYVHVWRPANLQPVYPFFFLFYVALARLIREQSRKNIALLALVIGVSFYVFAYLWQIAGITLLLFLLYALSRKNWALAKAIAVSGCIGGIIGLPIPVYMLWLSNASPYFWQSMGRLGLVNTHLPMAEVIYSGGWVGVILAFMAILAWRVCRLREDADFRRLNVFVWISGLGLWVMQGSNLFTGKLLETGEHVRPFILLWLIFVTVGIGVFLWSRRALFSKRMRGFVGIMLGILSVANAYYIYDVFSPVISPNIFRGQWQTEQQYAGPFAWLDENVQDPTVIWSDPHNPLAADLPIFTKHFTLDAYWGMLELAHDSEIRERYLVSQYFNNPTLADLKSLPEMSLYLGRHDLPHEAETINRGVKICQMLFFWNKNKNCGTLVTPQEVLGDKFFSDMETEFQTDIKPNIKAYLKKYHVTYILKDDVLDPTYQPEELGAVRVYADSRFEIYRLPQ